MKTQEYFDLVADLYNVSDDAKNVMLMRAPEIDERLSWYNDYDIRNALKEYYLSVDKRFPPKLGGILTILDSQGKKKFPFAKKTVE